ncbi:MAG TPA: hypothetical protein VGM53_14165 [Streptosporangiaceae bacterium]|jgi:hypothetical protein
MTVNFAEFDIAELKVLDARDALGLPEMGASVEVNYVQEMDDLLGDADDMAVAAGSCSCCCCCC